MTEARTTQGAAIALARDETIDVRTTQGALAVLARDSTIQIRTTTGAFLVLAKIGPVLPTEYICIDGQTALPILICGSEQAVAWCSGVDPEDPDPEPEPEGPGFDCWFQTETIDDNTPHYDAMDLGAEAPDRVFVAIAAFHGGSTLVSGSSVGAEWVSMTVGGVTEPPIVIAHPVPIGINAAMFAVPVPTGTTGDVDIALASAAPGGLADSLVDTGMVLFRMTGFEATPYDTSTGFTGGFDYSLTIDCPPGGIVVAGCYCDQNPATGIAWTGLDVVPDPCVLLMDHYELAIPPYPQKCVSCAYKVFPSGATDLVVHVEPVVPTDPFYGADSFYMVIASFAPL